MQHRLASDQLTVLVNSMGAEIVSIKNADGLEYIWTADKNIWGRHAPVLFPFVGKLKDDSFFHNKRIYQMTQHGFARDMLFSVSEINGQSCTFELDSNAETYRRYPFDFKFYIIYELAANKLRCSYKVRNPSKQALLFSVGAHPGFNCPLMPDEKYEDYYLEFEQDSFNQTTLIDGLRFGTTVLELENRRLFLSDKLFDKDALVFENNQINRVSLCSSKSSRQVKMECSDWPYFGIWARKGSSSYVCLEPWYGITDDAQSNQILDEKAGVIRLEAGQEFTCSFSMEFT